MMKHPTWFNESFLLELYLLLVHRIEGIGLSLEDFYRMDTWVLSKIYCMELELIDKEERLGKGKGSNPEEEDSPEMEALYDEMFNIEE